ncbi:MbtH family protein [Microbulbifer sp. OS29]|uniref:MbtH family protein n=1 Tax=Microbulbifer okhotskensis TaxID=2926617 RepID=A0A9X2J5L5_9GAMM|nr:MbtH family protein [Microbulbifer okhotskensis]MCO1334529.1 MbtH family protein [Microbulbifer okhotskensis]
MQSEYQNPFDDEKHLFFVLKNNRGQHSLWPEFAGIPEGWETIYGPQARGFCIAYVEENWKGLNH